MPTTPTPVILPSFVNSLLTGYARQALTSVAVGLAAHGYALSQSQTQTFVEQGTALVIIAASLGWSWFQARLNQKRLQVAASPHVVEAQSALPGTLSKVAVPLDQVVKAS